MKVVDAFGKEIEEGSTVILACLRGLVKGKVLGISVEETNNGEEDDCYIADVTISVLYPYKVSGGISRVSVYETWGREGRTGICASRDIAVI